MRSRAAARWRLPSSTTVRNERICVSMPKPDADRASPQSLLGITRPRAGVLPWVNYQLKSPHGYTQSDSNHHWILPKHWCSLSSDGFNVVITGMRPEDPKDRNPRNFDNSSNLNWRGILLFVLFTSVVLGLFLFCRNGNHRSIDRPAPRILLSELKRRDETRRSLTRGDDIHLSSGRRRD